MEGNLKHANNSILFTAQFYSTDIAELFRRNTKKLNTVSVDFYNNLYVKAKYNEPAAKRLEFWMTETQELLTDTQDKFLASCTAILSQKKPLQNVKVSEIELEYELNHPLFRKYTDFLQECDKSYILLHYRWLLGELSDSVLQNALKQIVNASEKFFSRINYLVKSAQKPFGGVYSNIAIKACLTDKYSAMVDESIPENAKVLAKISANTSQEPPHPNDSEPLETTSENKELTPSEVQTESTPSEDQTEVA